MRLKRRQARPARIEMLPLIDIVFLLLVFFIYAMLSMAVHHALPVRLPASASAPLVRQQQLAVDITVQAAPGNGLRLYLDERSLPLPQLAQVLRSRKTTSQEPLLVRLFVDQSVAYQQLFQVLDQIQQAGVSRIALEASRPAP